MEQFNLTIQFLSAKSIYHYSTHMPQPTSSLITYTADSKQPRITTSVPYLQTPRKLQVLLGFQQHLEACTFEMC